MPNDTHPTPASAGTRPPPAVLVAGLLVALQGAVSVAAAVWLVARQIAGSAGQEVSGWGTAAWFAAFGAGVLYTGVSLLRGQRWGRAIAIVVQLLLLPVAWTLLTGSGQVLWGLLLGVVVVATMAALMTGSASRWLMGD